MPKDARMPIERMIALRDSGKTYAEIAAEAGVSVWAVQKTMQRAGATKRQVNHKEWMPWPVKPRHSNSSVADYIRRLHHLSLGKALRADEEAARWNRDHVIRWAQRLVDENLDYDYDPNVPPNDFCVSGGFYARKADSKDWKIRKLVDAVIARQAPELDE